MKTIKNQVCCARIICGDKQFTNLIQSLEKTCKKYDCWYEQHRWKYPTIEYRHITKYMTEFRVGRESLRVDLKAQNDICPFYPLLTFPDSENSKYKKFETRMNQSSAVL